MLARVRRIADTSATVRWKSEFRRSRRPSGKRRGFLAGSFAPALWAIILARWVHERSVLRWSKSGSWKQL